MHNNDQYKKQCYSQEIKGVHSSKRDSEFDDKEKDKVNSLCHEPLPHGRDLVLHAWRREGGVRGAQVMQFLF